ncbi:RhoA signalling inhibitor virus release protein [NY_014 poxvirus]|uniref:RhoA signalling inhibitor virus release protein n=1 Tax=NY_014 poxvirus TaxID=2025360 RepID=UPI000B9A0F83|nr:RhoA signalling inhibitor virus release protein [NY_014 poxvirus]AST09442.1 RhoA signalling inhibitor virus release protein [NY_014 poxvirus]
MGFCIPMRSRRRSATKKSNILTRQPTPHRRTRLVSESEIRMKKNSYVENTNQGNMIVDNIFMSTISVDHLTDPLYYNDNDYEIKNELDVTYEIKEVYIPDSKLDFITDRDGNFEPVNCFMLKLKHGYGFTKGALYLGHSGGFVATICLKNEGISGLYINGTSVLRTNLKRGDTIVSRSTRGVQFLPQIGGDAVYLIVSLCPTKKFIDTGFIITPLLSSINSTVSARILAVKRKDIVGYIDSIILYRRQLESSYSTSHILTEFINYCNKNNNIIKESSLHEIIQKDLNLAHNNITSLVSEIKNVIVMLKTIIDKEDTEYINSYITQSIKDTNKDSSVVNCLSLSNLDFSL